MTAPLTIQPSSDTPKVVLEPSSGRIEIRGMSMPEDPVKFYQPVIDGVKKFTSSPAKQTLLIVDLDYFNSSSLKQLVLIMTGLEEIAKQGKPVKVEWHYDSGDELMEIKGQEIQGLVDLDFQLVPKKVKI